MYKEHSLAQFEISPLHEKHGKPVHRLEKKETRVRNRSTRVVKIILTVLRSRSERARETCISAAADAFSKTTRLSSLTRTRYPESGYFYHALSSRGNLRSRAIISGYGWTKKPESRRSERWADTGLLSAASISSRIPTSLRFVE